jgi:hypothetical protein
MASLSVDLQRCIYRSLIGDEALVALLGGPRVYDGAPRRAAFPYVTIDEIATRDWSTDSGAGFEHVVRLSAWSRHGGKREVHQLLDAIRDRLHDAALAMEDATLINLRFESSSAGDDGDGETFRGIVRFRAVTERAGT